jgi:triosephosphate isomerase (TIM)
MSRTPFLAGNWKMFKTASQARPFVAELARRCPDGVDAAVCVPFTALTTAVDAGAGRLRIFAQNMHQRAEGPFTGEVSGPMLADLGVDGVLLGHSERRRLYNETDAALSEKLVAAHEAGLEVILAIGETDQQRAGGQTEAVLRTQVTAAFAGLDGRRAGRTTVAYEPVWAIGTGRTATPETAQLAHRFVRAVLGELYRDDVAARMRIQYGGSMTPDNAAELLAQPDVDGGLVGGASLDADRFAAILQAAAP